MKFSQIFQALLVLYGISGDKEEAFRARLRHLRNLGVPGVPPLGSGHRVSYTQIDAAEMMIALDLESLGMKPEAVAPLCCSLAVECMHHTEGDVFLVVIPAQPGGTPTVKMMAGRGKVRDLLMSIEGGFAISDVGRRLRRLSELLRAAPAQT